MDHLRAGEGAVSESIQETVARDLAEIIARGSGYDWPVERVLRIAEDAVSSINEGISPLWAFADAFDTELCMYGNGSITEPTGILSINGNGSE